MKPLKVKDIYKTSNSWVRINYKNISESADGFYIMKRDVYEDNRKKFEKLLRDCLIEIIYDYRVTMYDICYSALRTYKSDLLTVLYRLKTESSRYYINEEFVKIHEENIKSYRETIARLERKLIWEE